MLWLVLNLEGGRKVVVVASQPINNKEPFFLATTTIPPSSRVLTAVGEPSLARVEHSQGDPHLYVNENSTFDAKFQRFTLQRSPRAVQSSAKFVVTITHPGLLSSGYLAVLILAFS